MSSLIFDAAPSVGWSINFLASAATGALFAPGTFQQSGWWMALAVACSAFVFSVGSFAAYVSLTIFVSRIQEASALKRLSWRRLRGSPSAGSAWETVTNLAAPPFRCRSVVTLSDDVRGESGSSAPSPPSAGKKTRTSTSHGSEPLGTTLDSVVVVDFVGGSLLLTKLYEATQLVQFSSAFLLKMASAVDLVVMFVSKNLAVDVPDRVPPPESQEGNSALMEALIPPLLRPLLSTTEGVATVVFSVVMLLAILPPPKVYKVVLRVADVVMLALHVLLGCFLLKHLLRQFGWSGELTLDALISMASSTSSSTRVPLVAYQDRVPEGMHLSETYSAHERFHFACVAILTSFIPHVSTPSIFREVPLWRAAPRLCASMVRWMFTQLLYFIFLGIVMDSVLPAGRTTSRMAVFNFVDYRTWLPNPEEDTSIVVCFALVPLVHVLSTARGLCETIATLLFRAVNGDDRQYRNSSSTEQPLLRLSSTPFSLLPAGTRTAICSVILLVVTHVSVTYRPLFWLITSNCVLHVMYLVLYLRVFKLLNPRRRKTLDTAMNGQLGKEAPTSSWWEALCVGGATQGVLPSWFLLAAIAFWVSCLLYWVS